MFNCDKGGSAHTDCQKPEKCCLFRENTKVGWHQGMF